MKSKKNTKTILTEHGFELIYDKETALKNFDKYVALFRGASKMKEESSTESLDKDGSVVSCEKD